jgi:hypothetical protein
VAEAAMSTDDKVLEDLSMPPSAVEALAKAFPDDVVKAIVADTTSAPRRTPSAAPSVVDALVERFGPEPRGERRPRDLSSTFSEASAARPITASQAPVRAD